MCTEFQILDPAGSVLQGMHFIINTQIAVLAALFDFSHKNMYISTWNSNGNLLIGFIWFFQKQEQ
jgi:hypothetical protein